MISFESPNFIGLNKKGYTVVDMHCHSVHSDGAATISRILSKCKKMNIGVAITDHNEISGSVDAFNKKTDECMIIPAIEVKSIENIDILFYFYDIDDLKIFFKKEILPFRRKFLTLSKTTISLKNLINLKNKYECVLCVAHPFGYGMRAGASSSMKKYEKYLKDVDVFEAMNGGTVRANNKLSIDYIRRNNKAFTGGSDAHSIYPLGNVVTVSKKKGVKEFLNSIKNNETYVIGQELRFHKFHEYFLYGINRIENVFSK